MVVMGGVMVILGVTTIIGLPMMLVGVVKLAAGVASNGPMGALDNSSGSESQTMGTATALGPVGSIPLLISEKSALTSLSCSRFLLCWEPSDLCTT